MIQNVTKKTLQVELLNMKISSDKQHMYTLNMHISIPNIVLLKLPCLQLLLSSADHHFKKKFDLAEKPLITFILIRKPLNFVRLV